MIYMSQPRSEVYSLKMSEIIEDYNWAVAREKARNNQPINNKNNTPKEETPPDPPNETTAEKNRRLVLGMIAAQKEMAQKAGGKHVTYE